MTPVSLLLLHVLAAAPLAASQDFLQRPLTSGQLKRLSDPPFGEGGDGKHLPAMDYRYKVFAVDDIEAAASFFERYSGATRLQVGDYQLAPRPNATVKGCRLTYSSGLFRTAFSDVYFVNEPGLPQGAKGPFEFGRDVFNVHSMNQEDWDWHQDWHLAFSVTDIDAVAARLIHDGVPFVNRISMYYAIPDTGITIQILGLGNIYWTEPFLFCRHTTDEINGKMAPYATNITAIDDALSRRIPEHVPSHAAMTSASAQDCAEWVYRLLPVLHVNEKTTPMENHGYADGVCADIRWVSISPGGWEIHFVEQYVKRDGGVHVVDHEQMVKDLRGDMTQWDAYMHNRLAVKVVDLKPYKARLDAQQEPYIFEKASGQVAARMFLSMPNRYVLELIEEAASELSGMPRLGTVDDSAARQAIATSLHESEEGILAPAIATAMRDSSRLSEV